MVSALVHLGVLRLPRDVAVAQEVGADEAELKHRHQGDGGKAEESLRRRPHTEISIHRRCAFVSVDQSRCLSQPDSDVRNLEEELCLYAAW